MVKKLENIKQNILSQQMYSQKRKKMIKSNNDLKYFSLALDELTEVNKYLLSCCCLFNESNLSSNFNMIESTRCSSIYSCYFDFRTGIHSTIKMPSKIVKISPEIER